MYARIFCVIPDPTFRTPDGELSYAKTFLVFILEGIFGGVGALEGRENVPARFIPDFSAKKIPYISAKILKAGESREANL